MVSQSMTYKILFPSSYSAEVSKLRQQLDEAHLAWSKEWKERQADFKIVNIRFVHDPHWNKRIFSLVALLRMRAGCDVGGAAITSAMNSRRFIRSPRRRGRALLPAYPGRSPWRSSG
jgi:hypothetical protein